MRCIFLLFVVLLLAMMVLPAEGFLHHIVGLIHHGKLDMYRSNNCSLVWRYFTIKHHSNHVIISTLYFRFVSLRVRLLFYTLFTLWLVVMLQCFNSSQVHTTCNHMTRYTLISTLLLHCNLSSSHPQWPCRQSWGIYCGGLVLQQQQRQTLEQSCCCTCRTRRTSMLTLQLACYNFIVTSPMLVINKSAL